MSDKLKIFRDRVSAYTSFIPFCFMVFNLIGYGIFYYLFCNQMEAPDWLFKIFELNGHFCDVSFLGLVLMLCTSKNWRYLSWMSFICICFLWIVNGTYILFSWEVDLYFVITALVIYIIFVILTLRVLTNAKN